MTDYSKILFLPASAVQELELRVDHAHNPQSDLTDIEKSDALESVGIAKYYNGEYKAAIFYLECAISGPYGVMKAPRRLAYVNLLVSINDSVITPNYMTVPETIHCTTIMPRCYITHHLNDLARSGIGLQFLFL